MAQILIENGESGLLVRESLNLMFAELYGAVGPNQPIVLLNKSTNFDQIFQQGSYITQIFIKPVSGSITLNIGTTGNGGEILPDTPITYMLPISPQYYFENQGYLYFTLTGTGVINVSIYYIQIS